MIVVRRIDGSPDKYETGTRWMISPNLNLVIFGPDGQLAEYRDHRWDSVRFE